MRKDLAESLTTAANAAGTSLAQAALLIARIEYPRLDVEAYLGKLDAMGELARLGSAVAASAAAAADLSIPAFASLVHT